MAHRFLSCLLSFVLATAALPALTGCESHALAAEDLMSGIQSSEPNTTGSDTDEEDRSSVSEKQADALANFAVTLFQKSRESGGSLMSPLSVDYALGMTANGAQGKTLSQMEQVLGLSVNELNESLHAYAGALPDNENCRLSVANSLWIRQGFEVEHDFLQTNATWYEAGMFEAPFDESTVADINRWTNWNTDGMIPDILDQIPANAVMYLINAIAFDAAWKAPYEDSQIVEDTFNAQDGSEQTADFMRSEENLYLENVDAVGFVKPYSDPAYAFAALLPKEGTSIDDLIENLDGENLRATLREARQVTVNAKLPKFEGESTMELNDTLATMGMGDAFDPDAADFTGISAGGNLFISRVLHKASIDVNEKGTKAGAVTSVEIAETSAPEEPGEIKTVYLDRPFVYLLIDRETNLPLFMGVVESLL